MKLIKAVSNLLGSPASGELHCEEAVTASSKEFPIYWVPQRVGSPTVFTERYLPLTFPIYWVPQRVGSSPGSLAPVKLTPFPIYWVPQRVGRSTRKGIING